MNDDPNKPYQSLLSALTGINQKQNNLNSIQHLKFAPKRSKHSARFAERIQLNAKIVDQLIDVIKALNKKVGTEAEVDALIDTAKSLLENNAKLKEQVGEALQDIPD